MGCIFGNKVDEGDWDFVALCLKTIFFFKVKSQVGQGAWQVSRENVSIATYHFGETSLTATYESNYYID